jgi:hypothetical protein
MYLQYSLGSSRSLVAEQSVIWPGLVGCAMPCCAVAFDFFGLGLQCVSKRRLQYSLLCRELSGDRGILEAVCVLCCVVSIDVLANIKAV